MAKTTDQYSSDCFTHLGVQQVADYVTELNYFPKARFRIGVNVQLKTQLLLPLAGG